MTLIELVKNGMVEEVTGAIDAGLAPTKEEFADALEFASARGDQSMVEALINAGADMNWISEYSMTALHAAVEMGQKDVIRMLARRGSDMNIHEIMLGRTPLHAAVEVEFDTAVQSEQTPAIDLVELVFSLGGDLAAVDSKGRTPLELAKELGHTAAVEFLERAKHILH